jgi:hypothetical protein
MRYCPGNRSRLQIKENVASAAAFAESTSAAATLNMSNNTLAKYITVE